MIALAELRVEVADPTAWSRIGLVVRDGSVQVGGVRIVVTTPTTANPARGVVSWGLAGIEPGLLADASDGSGALIDGLSVHVVPAVVVAPPAHPVGALRVDHAVVFTDSLERTCAALVSATGCELKRVREAGGVRQGFHRLGEVIAEVVESDRATCATYWGFVLEVADLDAACRLLGSDVIGQPRTAVQPGRRIATVRSAVGLGVPVALLSAKETGE